MGVARQGLLSSKRGGVSKKALDGKIVALLFADKPHQYGGNKELADGLKSAAEQFEHGLEVV